METTSPDPASSQAAVELARERTKQASIAGAGWTAGLSVFFGVVALMNAPTWPVAAGIAALSVMVTLVCFAILKR